VCGGLCLDLGVVVTAAHCTQRGLSTARWRSAGKYVYSRLSAVRQHPRFIGLAGAQGVVANDLAVAKATPQRAGPRRPRVASPEQGAAVLVAGFSRETGDLTPRAYAGRVTSVAPFEFVVEPVTHKHAPQRGPAGGDEQARFACSGDSGSPVASADGRELLGVVSRLKEPASGCRGGLIAARLDAYREFLESAWPTMSIERWRQEALRDRRGPLVEAEGVEPCGPGRRATESSCRRQQ